MTTPVWQPGTLYAPGAIVQPASSIQPVAAPVVNGDFEDGDSDWTKDAGWTIGQFGSGTHFTGTWSAQWDQTGTGRIKATDAFDVQPGQSITATAQVQQGASSSGQAGGRVEIGWYTSGDVLISYSSGNMIQNGSNQHWQQSSITATAPATAAKARIVGYAFRNSGGDELWMDQFTWNLQITALPTGLVFKATQANTGSSGSAEPVWPVNLGDTVVDNEVTWEGVYASRVVWEAQPILVSGASEPTFPALAGATVADNTIQWTAMTARVTQAPNSRIVAIAASKIFAGDNDIIKFSATVNCLDWQSANDAGYIPFGLNTYGGTPVSALGLYRSNLVAFNSQGFQMWQVDQDPANMAILDAVPIPCEYHDTAVPVSNDLVFLTARGVRSMGIAGASTNLQAGFFGQAVDPLVLEAIKGGEVPFALFYPGTGQYWLFFGEEAFVLTMTGKTSDASWSRYVFPSAIDAWAILGTDLYLRSGNEVWKMDADVLDDAATLQVPGDAFFDDVVLMVHCDGANGSTVFTDESYLANAVTANGGAQVTTTNSKFGGGALLGNNSGYLSCANIAPGGNLDIAPGDFTIEFWARTNSIATLEGTFELGDFVSNTGIRMYINSGQPFVQCSFFHGWGDLSAVLGNLTANTWYHFAIVRSGNTGRLYRNGVLDCVPQVNWTGTNSFTGVARFGNNRPGGFGPMAGAMDEIRITKAARYTSNFTPAAAPFEDATDAEYIGDEFEGYAAWNYLDFDAPGVDKELESVDLVCNGEVSISVGWDQRKGQEARATAAYTVDGDTAVGTPIPINLTAPSMQLRLTFSGHQAWEWTETVVNIV